MKKKYIFTLVTIFPLYIMAQTNITDSIPKNNIKLKAFSLIGDELKFQYERVFQRHISVALDIGYITDKVGILQIFAKQGPIDGIDISPEIRYYFTGKAPKGFYSGIYGLFIRFVDKSASYSRVTDAKIIGGGILFGKQWIINKQISIDADIGCGIYNSSSEIKDGEFNSGLGNQTTNSNLVRPILNLSFGYLF